MSKFLARFLLAGTSQDVSVNSEEWVHMGVKLPKTICHLFMYAFRLN